MPPRAPQFADWLTLLALTALWGSAFLLTELALRSFPPTVLVAGRIVIAAVVLLVFLWKSGSKLPALGRAWLPMLAMAIFGNVLPFQLIAWAQQHITSSLTGILMAVMPIFVMVLSHFLIPGSRLTTYRVAGFALGFAGVVIVIGPDLSRGLDGNLALWGALATLVAALSYAGNSVYARRLGAVDPSRLAAGMLLIASLLAAPAAVMDLPRVTEPGVAAIIALLILGLLATGLATLLYFRLVQGPGPNFLSFVNYLVPAWAVVAGALFLNEKLSSAVFTGLGFILAGIALSEIGPRVGRFVTRRSDRLRLAFVKR